MNAGTQKISYLILITFVSLVLLIGCSNEQTDFDYLSTSITTNAEIPHQTVTEVRNQPEISTNTPEPSPTLVHNPIFDLQDFKAILVYRTTEDIYMVELPCSRENQCRKNVVNLIESFSDWEHIEDFEISPTGEEFVFGSFDNSPNRINDMYVASFIDLRVRRLSQTNRDWESDFAWSPDGERIAFSLRQDQQPGGWSATLNIIDSNGCCLRQLPVVDNRNLAPQWSPDGQKIAFLSGDWDYHLYILDVATNEIHSVSSAYTLYEAWEFAWSPDGSRIAFVSMDQENQDICIVDVNSIETNCIAADSKLWESRPSWSSDGNNLLYSAFDPTTRSHSIYIINTDGSANQKVTSSNNSYTSPLWLENTEYFLCLKRVGEYFNQIVLMTIDGKWEQVLINEEDHISIIDILRGSSWPDN